MAFTIKNRAKRLLIIPLNSGESLFLAPGEASEPVEAYELDNNEKVDKLLRDNLIVSSESEDEGDGDAEQAAPVDAESHAAAGAESQGGAAAAAESRGGASEGETPPDTNTDSALNTSPAPSASSLAPPPPTAGGAHKGKLNK